MSSLVNGRLLAMPALPATAACVIDHMARQTGCQQRRKAAAQFSSRDRWSACFFVDLAYAILLSGLRSAFATAASFQAGWRPFMPPLFSAE
jgi:hypothetical protein